MIDDKKKIKQLVIKKYPEIIKKALLVVLLMSAVHQRLPFKACLNRYYT